MHIIVRGSLQQSSSRVEPFIAMPTSSDQHNAGRGFHSMTAAIKKSFLSTLIILILAAAALAQPQLPAYTGMVNDFAGKLSDGKKQQLESLLENFDKRSGIQVAIATVNYDDLQGYPIEQYALELGRKWEIGRDSQKRALLLLVAIQPPD